MNDNGLRISGIGEQMCKMKNGMSRPFIQNEEIFLIVHRIGEMAPICIENFLMMHLAANFSSCTCNNFSVNSFWNRGTQEPVVN